MITGCLIIRRGSVLITITLLLASSYSSGITLLDKDFSIIERLQKDVSISASLKNKINDEQESKIDIDINEMVKSAYVELLYNAIPNDVSSVDILRAAKFRIAINSDDDKYLRSLIRMQVRSVLSRISFLRKFPPVGDGDRKKMVEAAQMFWQQTSGPISDLFRSESIGDDDRLKLNSCMRGLLDQTKNEIEADDSFSFRYREIPDNAQLIVSARDIINETKKSLGKKTIPNSMLAQIVPFKIKHAFSIMTTDKLEKASFDPLKIDPVYSRLVKEYEMVCESAPKPNS